MQQKDDTTKKIDWQAWANLYDIVRYPPAIYEELVVKKRPCDQRFNVMGAWKTGCITRTGEHLAYTVESGTTHYFSKRWRPDCPVGYRTWNDLSRQDAEIVSQVPRRLASEPPYLVTRLCRRKGFGFIWAVFVLHCIRPESFPLYDQHVYRAYRWLETGSNECPNQAPSSWEDYRLYAGWFSRIVDELSLPYWTLDRAIWTFGKSIKKSQKEALPEAGAASSLVLDNISDEWVHEITFGGKKKSFWWMVDEKGTVRIKRVFRGSKEPRETAVRKDEMDHLNDSMRDGAWWRLSNNVTKLRDRSEQPGIGRFFVNKLSWPVTDAQVAGQLGVILTKCGVWDYNGKKAGIQHRSLLKGWRKPLIDYYQVKLAETTGL